MNPDKQLMAFAISALMKPPLLTLADAARELRQIKAAAKKQTSDAISKRGRS